MIDLPFVCQQAVSVFSHSPKRQDNPPSPGQFERSEPRKRA
jgi:hypothetical protein